MLLTGGAGFIGSQLARELVARGRVVRVLDALTYAGRAAHLSGVDCELVVGDITDPAAVAAALDGCGDVVHAAAESHVERSLTDPGGFVRTNVEGTRVLLQAAVDAGVRRFLHLSTDEVLGEVAEGALGPDAPTRPGNPYAASKAGAEALVHAWRKTHGLSAAMVRLVNCYGPRQHPEKAVPWWIRDALAGGPVPVQGRGTAARDWLFVEDAARGLAQALDCWQDGAIWHLAAHAQRPNLALCRAVVELVAARTGRTADIGFLPERQGQDIRYALDDAATRRALSWAPRVSLQDGLARTVAWVADEGLALWAEEG
ncbi:MAG: NAD-dependent epimerase/dehydratase family protein [Alphaproteobacteria bacterium]|nr:NAD-dependent epimerase/dehydratase family protein [Alphaproteobacteria bacterium]